MQQGIHPAYQAVGVTCSCGATYTVKSTLSESFRVDVCAQCHPFYTGKQKLIDTGGRVKRFMEKYESRKKK